MHGTSQAEYADRSRTPATSADGSFGGRWSSSRRTDDGDQWQMDAPGCSLGPVQRQPVRLRHQQPRQRRRPHRQNLRIGRVGCRWFDREPRRTRRDSIGCTPRSGRRTLGDRYPCRRRIQPRRQQQARSGRGWRLRNGCSWFRVSRPFLRRLPVGGSGSRTGLHFSFNRRRGRSQHLNGESAMTYAAVHWPVSTVALFLIVVAGSFLWLSINRRGKK